MYLAFVCPAMEFGNVVWGGSYDCDILKLENIQIDAIRLITGATARSNIKNLYNEVCIPNINTRIDNASISMMYRMVNNLVPQYLCQLVEKEDQDRPYNFRHRNPLKIPFCHLETYRRSFVPRTIGLWNSLDQGTRSANTLDEFKSKLKPKVSDTVLLYYYGARWPSVHHARMRIGCSKLHGDLCNSLHVINDPSCMCGHPLENAYHYFLECPLFAISRLNLIARTYPLVDVTVDNLLYGSINLTLEENKRVFEAVHEYIIDTNRFA